jgi:hypothetical protein
MIRNVHSGSGSRIRILIFFTHPGSRIQGSKRHRIPDPDSQHCISRESHLFSFSMDREGYRPRLFMTRELQPALIPQQAPLRPRPSPPSIFVVVTRTPTPHNFFSWRPFLLSGAGGRGGRGGGSGRSNADRRASSFCHLHMAFFLLFLKRLLSFLAPLVAPLLGREGMLESCFDS